MRDDASYAASYAALQAMKGAARAGGAIADAGEYVGDKAASLWGYITD